MKYKDYKKLVLSKKEQLESLKKELSELYKECPHEELVLVEKYYEGSYYDKASTVYYNQCTLCHKTSEETVKVHGWYG